MVRAVHQSHADSLYRRACKLAVRHRLLNPLVDRGPVALRDRSPDDLVNELIPDAAVDRLDHDVAVAELAAAACLLAIAAVGAGPGTDRLEVGHARRVQLDVNGEAPLCTLERDLDVHLAHPGEDLLPGLLITTEAQRRVLLGEPADRRGDLLLLAFRPRGDGEAHHRFREHDLG